jgi:hypothetical protein
MIFLQKYKSNSKLGAFFRFNGMIFFTVQIIFRILEKKYHFCVKNFVLSFFITYKSCTFAPKFENIS